MLADKNAPSPEWIEFLRRKFPCETEVDRVLTRKLTRRSSVRYTPVSLQEMCGSLRSLLESSLSDPFEIRAPSWLSGGASKIQMYFELDWVRPGVGRTITPMVVRMEPAESIVETSRRREYEIIEAVADIVPVPPVFYLDADASHFPHPAIVYGYVDGVTKPSDKGSNVAGHGIAFGEGIRRDLGGQFVEQLARLHTWDWKSASLDSFDVPPEGQRSFEMHLNWWRRAWEEDSNRDIPLIRCASGWLDENMPSPARLSLLHGDYRAGNFLFTESDNRISAWLDWELGHIGDFHEDLAYTTLPSYERPDESGKTLLANGLMPAHDLYEAYEKASGNTVNLKTIDYFQVFHAYRIAVIVIGTGYRAARNNMTHQDLLLTWIMGLGYVTLDFLRKKLEAVG